MAKGSVRKKGKKWYYRFYVEDASGNLVQKECVGTESKSETEKLLRQAMDDYEKKKFVAKAENLTVGQLLDVWAEEELKTGTLSNGTVENYLGTIRNIKKHPLAERKLKNVTSEHLQSFFDLLSFGEFIPMEKRERGIAKITSILFPQSCSSPSVLQYFQSSILRSIPCSILNCGIRRTKLICFRMRTWTEISNQFHEKIMKDCLRIFKKRTQPQYFQSR